MNQPTFALNNATGEVGQTLLQVIDVDGGFTPVHPMVRPR